jgi:hypothetical protein
LLGDDFQFALAPCRWLHEQQTAIAWLTGKVALPDIFVRPLIGDALLDFRQRPIVLRYRDEAMSHVRIRRQAR